MSHVFLIVLALHVIVIGGALVFNWMRDNKKDDGQQQLAESSPSKTEETIGADNMSSEPVVETSPVKGDMASDKSVPTPEDLDAAEGGVSGGDFGEPAVASVKQQPTQAKNKSMDQAKQPVAAAVAAAPTKSVSHTVAKGDTLHKISKKYGVSVADLRASNAMKNDMIRLGQTLKIGVGSAVVAKAEPVPAKVEAAASSPKAAVPSKEGVYVVGKGDTLVRIAKKMGVTQQSLIQANQIKDPSRISIGTKLVIPKGEVSTGEAAQPPVENKSRKASNLAMAGSH